MKPMVVPEKRGEGPAYVVEVVDCLHMVMLTEHIDSAEHWKAARKG